MGIRSPQQTLNQLYAARDAYLAGVTNPQAEIAGYTLEGGRRVEIRSWEDYQALEKLIQRYESAVVACTPIVLDAGNGHHWGWGDCDGY